MLHPGQPVVCIDAKPFKWGRPTGLIEGARYTIAAVGDCWDGPWVLLVELDLPLPRQDFGWAAERFRPVEYNTDISMFKKMLLLERV